MTRDQNKLTPNCEGPYRAEEVLGQGAYKLAMLGGVKIKNAWNIQNLQKFYS